MTEIWPLNLFKMMRASLLCWHWTFCWLTLDILWQTNGHKLNVRLFEEITQGHVKAKEDLRLRIDFVSRASLVFPLARAAHRRTWLPSGECCVACRQSRTGKRLCTSGRVQTRSLTGWTPVRCPSGSPKFSRRFCVCQTLCASAHRQRRLAPRLRRQAFRRGGGESAGREGRSRALEPGR